MMRHNSILEKEQRSESTFSKMKSFWANRLSYQKILHKKNKKTAYAGTVLSEAKMLTIKTTSVLKNFYSQQLACGRNFTGLKWLFSLDWCHRKWEPYADKSEAEVCLKRSMLNSVQLEDWRVCCFLLSSFVACPPTAHNAHWAPLHSTLMDSGEVHQVLLDTRFQRLCCAAGTSALTGLCACLLCNNTDALKLELSNCKQFLPGIAHYLDCKPC